MPEPRPCPICLARAYEAAWDEWLASDAWLWEAVIGDGIE